MSHEILTVAQMYAADRYAAEHGMPSLTLMENAGRAVADEIVKRWPPRSTVVLCGPGNNGGDGFVVARLLKERGWDVRVALLGERKALKGDAAEMAMRWNGRWLPLSAEALKGAELIVDALFGAGLQRPLEGAARDTVLALNGAEIPVVAIDIPSGLHGDLGRPLGRCLRPGRRHSHFLPQETGACADARANEMRRCRSGADRHSRRRAEAIQPEIFENGPALWGKDFPGPIRSATNMRAVTSLVVSGPAHATGAARLAARGALRIGAGLVSVASPPDAVAVNAAHLTSVMVKPFEGAKGLAGLLKDKRFNAVVIGPGCGVGPPTLHLVDAVMAKRGGRRCSTPTH